MNNNREYWDRKIIDWEDSTRGRGQLPLIERIAALFRGPLKVRTEMCFDLIAPFASNRSVVELGCGSGFFAFELFERARPKSITGIDISENAVERANRIAREKGLEGSVKFLVGDVSERDLPEADVMFGLGFLDYLTLEEIRDLFQRMNCKHFLFTFPESRWRPRKLMHMAYLSLQSCPKHFYFSKDDMLQCIGDGFQDIRFENHKNLGLACIVHNVG